MIRILNSIQRNLTFIFSHVSGHQHSTASVSIQCLPAPLFPTLLLVVCEQNISISKSLEQKQKTGPLNRISCNADYTIHYNSKQRLPKAAASNGLNHMTKP